MPRQEDVREVNLIAQDTAGYQALVARPLLEGLARTVIELAALPKVSGDREVRIWPTTLDLPGLEQFGGPRAAAALSAPAPLWLYNNLWGLKPSWAEPAYELAGASSMLRMDRDVPGPDAIARWIDRGE